jgi:hypothetical protein
MQPILSRTTHEQIPLVDTVRWWPSRDGLFRHSLRSLNHVHHDLDNFTIADLPGPLSTWHQQCLQQRAHNDIRQHHGNGPHRIDCQQCRLLSLQGSLNHPEAEKVSNYWTEHKINKNQQQQSHQSHLSLPARGKAIAGFIPECGRSTTHADNLRTMPAGYEDLPTTPSSSPQACSSGCQAEPYTSVG